MEIVISVLLTIPLIIALLMAIRRLTNGTPEEEKIAYTKRVITNLIPITLLLITNAEYMYGGKTGKFKHSYVFDELYRRIPDEFKKYVREENINTLINTVLPMAEELWIDNPQLVNRA